jgi:hypothetical protein
LVSRGKGILFQLLRLNPAKIRYSNRMGFLVGRDGGPIDNQVEVIAMVALSAAGGGSADIHFDGDASEKLAS